MTDAIGVGEQDHNSGSEWLRALQACPSSLLNAWASENPGSCHSREDGYEPEGESAWLAFPRERGKALGGQGHLGPPVYPKGGRGSGLSASGLTALALR